jgi:hypothetical protein
MNGAQKQFCSKDNIKFIWIIVLNSSVDGGNHTLEMSETTFSNGGKKVGIVGLN